MAISQLSNAELGHAEELYGVLGGTSNAFVSTANPKNGSYHFRTAATGGTGQLQYSKRLSGGALDLIYQSLSCWFYVTTMPSVNGAFVRFMSGGVAKQRLQLSSTGVIALLNSSGANVATSDSGVIYTGKWFRMDLDCGYNSGLGIRVYIDGILVANNDTAVMDLCDTVYLGCNTSSTFNFDWDDVVLYDSYIPSDLIGAEYKIYTLLPVSDNSRGGWLDGGGGTTNLYDSLNNVPPVGVNAATNGTKLRNTVASATDNADFNLETYDNQIPNGDTIRALQLVVNDAQKTTTGSPKAGALGLVSNPSQFEFQFDFGLPNGNGSVAAAASGTFPTGWGTHFGYVAENPSVSRSTNPVGRIGKRSATSQEVNVDYMGLNALVIPQKAQMGWGVPIAS